MKALKHVFNHHKRFASNLVKTAQVASLNIHEKQYIFLYGESNQNYEDFLNEINKQANTKFNSVRDANNKDIDLKDNISESSHSRIIVEDLSDPNSKLIIDTTNTEKEAQLIIQNNAILHRNKIEKLTQEAYSIDDKLKPLHKKRDEVVAEARKQSDTTLLGFLGCWTITTVSIARLTWWEYSWDIMEPVAWATQASGFLFWGWYYYITRTESTMSDITSRIYDNRFEKKLKRANFDIEAYNKLVIRRKEIERQVQKHKNQL